MCRRVRARARASTRALASESARERGESERRERGREQTERENKPECEGRSLFIRYNIIDHESLGWVVIGVAYVVFGPR